ncbi:MAG: tRNA guanosine(34) transglycosylase Tgt [Chloroflexi bacterium]|nr:tRNA guanosine(34) transglycosylase Tgt [Chloroflexota bacterium]
MLRFSLLSPSSSRARAGLLTTPHGQVPTPAFMPVGTQAAVKAVTPEDLRAAGATIVLSNTYHLYLRPGVKLIEQFGGLHRFMGWDGPILTDSGGFQVFSLGHMRKLTEEGATFRSHIDGSEHRLTPELAVAYQEALGSDIAMVLDHCPAYGESPEAIAEATERTHRWAERSLKAQRRGDQALFAIVQGGWSSDLRRESARRLAGMGFPGYAIGGVSVGEPKALAYRAVEDAEPHLPKEKPRYLMGVGSPEDLVQCIARGIDLFDCALPTRVARNGSLFTRQGRVSIRNAKHRDMDAPFDASCDCYACKTFSAAYLHHLFKSDEILYHRLGTIHNLRFILRLMEESRAAILGGTFDAFARAFLDGYKSTDEETRLEQKGKWAAAREARGLQEE